MCGAAPAFCPHVALVPSCVKPGHTVFGLAAVSGLTLCIVRKCLRIGCLAGLQMICTWCPVGHHVHAYSHLHCLPQRAYPLLVTVCLKPAHGTVYRMHAIACMQQHMCFPCWRSTIHLSRPIGYALYFNHICAPSMDDANAELQFVGIMMPHTVQTPSFGMHARSGVLFV